MGEEIEQIESGIVKAAQEVTGVKKGFIKEPVEIETPSPVISMQHVVITLADGRRGVFMGPELIKEVEMKLGMVPQLTSVDFDPPKAIQLPPREVPGEAIGEVPSADTKIDQTPATDVEEKA